MINNIVVTLRGWCCRLPNQLIILAARLAIAAVFWRSAQTKFSGWQLFGQDWQFFNLNQSTFTLFEYEYDLPIIDPEVAAYLATFAEFWLSLALIFGLFTRLSALALLGMTGVIQMLVYPDAWPTHILWAASLLFLIKHGGGLLSLDRLLFKGNA
ncbi:MAG: DoxX family protein [Gammaproteobacteria bacterium]|nr:DoxX family protein [Gammaproteobacteria bacterium]